MMETRHYGNTPKDVMSDEENLYSGSPMMKKVINVKKIKHKII